MSSPSSCVESWLSQSGLGYAIPNFRMAGILSPRSFSELELSYFEPLGVQRPEDRKRLFFLIQKVKDELNRGVEDGCDVVLLPVPVENQTVITRLRLPGHQSRKYPKSTSSTDGSSHSEVGISVETNSNRNLDAISPVTLASPLSNIDDFENIPASSKYGRMARSKTKLPTSSLSGTIEESFKSGDRPTKPLVKLNGTKFDGRAEFSNFSTSKSPAASDTNSNPYTDDFDECPSSDRGSMRGKSQLRSSMLPRIQQSSPQLDFSAPNTILTTGPHLGKNTHSRLTMKTTNQKVKSSYAAVPPSKEDDDGSMNSDTSDLSSSIQSFNSLGFSRGLRRNSRMSSGTYTSSLDEHLPTNSLETMPSISTRNGNKRLSTIPSTTVAPVSPLVGLSASKLKEYDDTHQSTKFSRRPSSASTKIIVRNTSLRPGTSDSLNSKQTYNTKSTHKTLTSAASARSLARVNLVTGSSRPSSRYSIGSNHSNEANARRATAKSPHRMNRPASKSPISSRRPTQVDKPVSLASSSYKQSVAIYKSRVRVGAVLPVGRVNSARPRDRSLTPTKSIRTASPVNKSNIPVTTGEGKSPTNSRGVFVHRQTEDKSNRSVTPTRSIRTASPVNKSNIPVTTGEGKSSNNSRGVFVHGQTEDKSWGTQIAQLREGFAREHDELMREKIAYQEDENFEMRIRVIVRKRPLSKREAVEMGDIDVVHPLDYLDHGRILVYQPKTKLDLAKEVETTSFAFDNVFNEGSNNMEIYSRAVQSLIPGIFRGKWASVFAYGQSGSGKTFTMMGSNMTGKKAGNNHENLCEENLGLYFLAARDVFRIADEPEFRNISFSVSLFEIYGGKLIDLLNRRMQVKCLEDSKGKVCFPGLTEHPVHTADQLMDVIEKGSLNRSTGATSANADSSRSHAVLQLSLRKDVGRVKRKEHGRLSFIDLAGSERGADTNQASKATRLEGAEINTSLLALKEVIRALATGGSMNRIPFRGSKLTQVLKDSFVGKNTRTVMVSCIAPNMRNCDHTLNTLRYADRVKERNPLTGELSAAVMAVSQIKRDTNERVKIQPPPRALTAPASSFRIEHDEESSDEYNIPPPPVDKGRILTDEPRFCPDLDQENFSLGSRYSDFLDESVRLVDDDTPELASMSNNDDENLIDDESRDTPGTHHSSEAQSLISTHKSIMSEQLKMLKHEVALVSQADENRDNIDQYLSEIDILTESHLSMLSSLRESLVNYNSSKSSNEN